MSKSIPYLECPHPDETHIALEYYEGVDSIRFLEEDHSVALHQHDFYEMVLILRGTCQHFYRGSYIPLIPGDLFLIPPNRPHSYRFQENITICNCQFYPDILTPELEQIVADIEYVALQEKTSARKRMQDMKTYRQSGEKISLRYVGDINSQGIIHLGQTERQAIFGELQDMLEEQRSQKFGFSRVKQMLLEHMLIQIKRVQMAQFESRTPEPTWKDEMVDAVLGMIESDLSLSYDFNKIAKSQNITTSYFRSIFKSITGLSPIEYLNRVRILRALDLLQTTELPITEIALKVGFNDPNYFSRLFKRILGYSPRHFRTTAS
ncbi:MAG: AraC family transcriptional regulator [Butyricicoccus sp.]|nr:AraC family transcriptional regulator [Butyricicoccus sp.]MBQ8584730.1 AraC family transcriptional regulator [Butyricicoccus sp.]